MALLAFSAAATVDAVDVWRSLNDFSRASYFFLSTSKELSVFCAFSYFVVWIRARIMSFGKE